MNWIMIFECKRNYDHQSTAGFVLKNDCPFSVKGKWTSSSSWNTIPDPLNGEPFIKVAEVDVKGIQVSSISVVCSLITFYNQN